MTTITEATTDPRLFGPWFKDRPTWFAWFSFLAALFALPMTAEQLATYQRCTGRTVPPSAPASEGWLICGRRSGKSFILALVAVFIAAFRDYRDHLAPGERAMVLVIATDRRQARVIFRYLRALLKVPMLTKMVERETSDSIDLSSAVTIEVATTSFRTTRGYTFAAVLADECAFWPTDDSAEPDYAVLDAIRPGMLTIPDAMLLCASSPYARRGALFDAFRRYWGKDDAPALVWKADTLSMNPTVPKRIIDAAYERDPASAAAEYGAEFRNDISAFIDRAVVEAAIDPGVFERAPISEGVRYHAFVDPSGGSNDSMALGIAHHEKGVLILDALRERKAPFSPEAVVNEFAELLRRYHVSTVHGDRYGGEWPREQFVKCGISYRVSERTCSDIYAAALPELNSKNIALLDNARLVAQLCSLERRTSRGGRDQISHPVNQHDDVCNAACGALLLAKPRVFVQQGDVGGSPISIRGGSPSNPFFGEGGVSPDFRDATPWLF